DLAGSITSDQYRVGETMITGTFTGDVNFARLVINGTPSNAWGGTFNADGTFSFYVANLGIKAGDKVEIQALNRQINGNTEAIEVLETKEVTVIDQLQGTITPDQYSYTDTMITGTFTGDINFANLVIDGQSVGNWGGTFNKETGRFEFFVHAQFRDQIRTATKVELQTYHRETVDGQTIDHKLVLQPVEIVKAAGTIQPAAFKVTESEITGTFTGDVNFANLIVDGRSISWGGTFNTANQTFTYFVNQTTRDLIRDAETVELVAYHREVVSGRPVDTELDRSVVTIDKEFTGTITPNPYKLGDRTITGTYTGDDINFARLEIDGMILWVSGFADGTFTAYLNQEQANSVTKDSQMTIYALHRFADLSTREIAQATVSITE
ncbi:autolysin modifier protein, partial [Enterococcus casseliflavus]|nr:autolysin modifier protein [Enterococcus casseliflavus]